MNPPQPEPSQREYLAAVVPCYNAGDRVYPVVHDLEEQTQHIVVVDDGSTDGAAQKLDTDAVRLVAFPENRGKGEAMLAGFRAALEWPEVTCIAILDADGQHDPAELPALYRAFIESDADLLIGARSFGLEHVPWRSRFGNRLTALLTRLLLHQSIPDTQSGFRLHSRRFVERIVEAVPGGRYETEMEILVRAVREGYTVASAPIATIYEEGNRSSHFDNVRDSFRIYKRLFAASFRIPKKGGG